MRKIAIIFFVAISAYALTLEEKIEMARRAADASVEGKVENVDIVNGRIPSIAESEKKVEINRKQTQKLQKSVQKVEEKYVVDTTKDFIGGRFIGRVGQTEAEKKDMIDSMKKAQDFSKKAEDFTFAETDLFFIAGKDAESVSQMKKIANSCENAFEQLFAKNSYISAFAVKTSIRIFSSDTQMKSDVLTSKSSGMLFIDICWHKDLKLESVCRAMALSVFERLAMSREQRCNIPQWLAWGIECIVLDEIRLGVSTFFARVASDNPYKDIVSILNYSTSNIDEIVGKAHSFWLLKALQKLSDKQSVFALVENISAMNLSSQDTFEQFKKMMSLPDNVDADSWLGCVICSEICARSGGVDSCKDSLDEVLRLCSIRVFENGEPTSVACDKLLSSGDVAKFPAKVRLLEIKMLLSKVNPVYFNTLVILGEVYEAFESGDSIRYQRKLTEFFDEFAKARNTAKEVEKIMNKNFGKMSVK